MAAVIMWKQQRKRDIKTESNKIPKWLKAVVSNSSNGTDLDYCSFDSRKRGIVAFGLHLHNNGGISRILHFLSPSSLHKTST